MLVNASIAQKINAAAPYLEQMPGVVIIHKIDGFTVEYMTANGQKLLGVTLPELIAMGTQYYDRFFNMDDMADFIPKIDILLRNNSHEEYFSYFQQVRYAGETDWTWHISAVKIFMWDDEGKPLLTITTAYPINKIKSLEVKAQNLLDENTFLLKNMGLFASLGKREKVVLKQVALGKTSAEIADELFISADTVQTHRRNIRNKLGITSAVEFAEYARAFDLV
jgi:DNA-binding CsgD family transcriptional regulator